MDDIAMINAGRKLCEVLMTRIKDARAIPEEMRNEVCSDLVLTVDFPYELVEEALDKIVEFQDMCIFELYLVHNHKDYRTLRIKSVYLVGKELFHAILVRI
jgi:hypothetical protein